MKQARCMRCQAAEMRAAEALGLLTDAQGRIVALTAALQRLVAADNCNYERDTMRSEGMFEQARAALGE